MFDLNLLDGVTKTPNGCSALCPAHDDHRPSLSVWRGKDGRWVLKCHRGCGEDEILQALGLSEADLWPATYDYPDEQGTLLYQVVRCEPKDFRLRRPDGRGGYIWDMKGVRRVLYRLPELKGCGTVLVVEGEKDANLLWSVGLPATTNSGGAGKWKDAFTAQLTQAGASIVIVIEDNDPPGRQHAETVASSCHRANLSVKVIELPGMPPKGDVNDYLGHHTKDELLALIDATSLWTPPQQTGSATARQGPSLVRMSDVSPKPVSWLWPGRLARGKLSIVAGEPGEGKSSLLIDVCARLSTGSAWPDSGTAPLGNVLLLTAEDDLADTVRVRLDACGADSSRIHVLDDVLDLRNDVSALEYAMAQVRPCLVVIDPLSAYLGETNTWKDSEVRARLAPLAALAQKFDCAIVAISHFSKDERRKALNRVMGSIGFVAAARSVLVVTRDPSDENRRLLLAIKNNLDGLAPGLAFRVEPDRRVVWEPGPVVGITADIALSGAFGEEPEARTQAEQFLKQLLANGPVLAKDAFRQGRENGHSPRTLKRAKAALNVQCTPIGFQGAWEWWLPSAPGHTSGAAQRGQGATTAPVASSYPVAPSSDLPGEDSADQAVPVAPSGPLCEDTTGLEEVDIFAILVEASENASLSPEGANLFNEKQDDPNPVSVKTSEAVSLSPEGANIFEEEQDDADRF